MKRREWFIAAASVAWCIGSYRRSSAAEVTLTAKFTMDLCPGKIGAKTNQRQAILLASRHGFQSVEPQERLGKIAKVYHEHGIRLGLEYVGPKTSWTSKKFPFIHTMTETKELIHAIDSPNVGFVLDSWHWYCANETVEDLLTLTNEQIVAVDLNDAPSGIPREHQIDSRRELPSATGVINVKAFLNALRAIEYDGPVRAEPFDQKLNAIDDEEAVKATAAAMKKAISA